MPKTCADCRAQQEHTENPNACVFGECPREKFQQHPQYLRLARIYAFAMLALASWEHEDEMTGEKNRKYGIDQSLQQFLGACRIKRIPDEKLEEALMWADIVAKAANEAPELAMMELLAQVRQGA